MDALSQEELFHVLQTYDVYIQRANEDDRYKEGFYPVTIDEFFTNEYQLLLDGDLLLEEL